MKVDLFKYILNLLLIPLMTVSLVMLTDGRVDTITGNNVIGFILAIISFIIIVVINVDNKK